MAARQKKEMTRKVPAFKHTEVKLNAEEDLKKVKAQTIKELKEAEKNKKEWYDNEMDKNLNKL